MDKDQLNDPGRRRKGLWTPGQKLTPAEAEAAERERLEELSPDAAVWTPESEAAEQAPGRDRLPMKLVQAMLKNVIARGAIDQGRVERNRNRRAQRRAKAEAQRLRRPRHKRRRSKRQGRAKAEKPGT